MNDNPRPASATDSAAATPSSTTGSGVNGDAIQALEQGVRAAEAYGRPDFVARLNATRDRLLEPEVNVVVVGEFKQGKSSFINALLNSRVCPVDDDIATAVPTSIRHGDPRAAWALVQPVEAAGEPATNTITELDGEESSSPAPERREIPFENIADFATERTADSTVTVSGVDVALPRQLLADGLVLVDTPGVGGLGSAHATAALGALSVADAAIFLSDSSQEYTRAEIDFLSQAIDMCPHVICVMTKTDFYPAWRKVMELNRGHLTRAGHDLPILPASSTLRIEAIRRDDRELNAESGFPDVVRVLNDDIVGGAAARERNRARQDLLGVTDQLISQFESELSALNDPEARAELTRKLEDAKLRSEQLRGQAAKWSTTLNDGVGDLTSDVDHDFRQRMRNVLAEADQSIEQTDPAEMWAEFEPWLGSRMSFEVVGNYRYLTDRSMELSRTVAEHFEFAGGEVLEQLDIQNPAGALGRVSADTSLSVEESSGAAKGMTVLRGSYSGILMFTMLGSMIGIALGPVAIGIGLAMGRKGLRDEKDRQKTMRRTQARNSVRRYTDEVSFQVNKDSRDTLRRTQRQIRDFYSARAEELHRSTSEALSAANHAAQAGEAERAARVQDVTAELGRLQRLKERALALVGPAPGPATTPAADRGGRR